MDTAIAYMSRFGVIDAAHYTWVHVMWPDVHIHTKESLNKLLLDHGDYATPLRSEDLKMPFEHMAIVWELPPDPEVAEYEYVLLVIDCKDSQPKVANLYFLHPTTRDLVLVARATMRATKEERAKLLRENGNKPVFDWGGEKEEQSIVQPTAALPPEKRGAAMQLLAIMVQTGLRYIAAASEGLLTGEQIDYHKATSNPSNAKRIKKGKAPLYEWRTVQLERKPPELPAAPQGGTHASPRLHQRRGHWATSKLGKKYWRRETVVGKPENGMIFHDYTSGEANHV